MHLRLKKIQYRHFYSPTPHQAKVPPRSLTSPTRQKEITHPLGTIFSKIYFSSQAERELKAKVKVTVKVTVKFRLVLTINYRHLQQIYLGSYFERKNTRHDYQDISEQSAP